MLVCVCVCVRARCVSQVKLEKEHGYNALQVGTGHKHPNQTTKPLREHYAKAGLLPKASLGEFQVTEDALLPVGMLSRAPASKRRRPTRRSSPLRCCCAFGVLPVLCLRGSLFQVVLSFCYCLVCVCVSVCACVCNYCVVVSHLLSVLATTCTASFSCVLLRLSVFLDQQKICVNLSIEQCCAM
jgi:hypothetical protein